MVSRSISISYTSVIFFGVTRRRILGIVSYGVNGQLPPNLSARFRSSFLSFERIWARNSRLVIPAFLKDELTFDSENVSLNAIEITFKNSTFLTWNPSY
jgi:hypothetical protein